MDAPWYAVHTYVLVTSTQAEGTDSISSTKGKATVDRVRNVGMGLRLKQEAVMEVVRRKHRTWKEKRMVCKGKGW